MIATMSKMIKAIQDWLEGRKKPRVPPLRVFREYEDSLSLIEDYDHIIRNFLGRIREVCSVRKIALLIHNTESGRFEPSASSDDMGEGFPQALFSRGSRLVKWLKVNGTFLDVSSQPDVLEYLDPGKSGLLESSGIAVCFPLMSMNRLIGILLVGAKESGEAFPAEELAFISSMLPQTGIALENALLFKERRGRFRRMSRADRLATIGELAAGAAHEIRNPLTAIQSSLQFLESRGGDETTRKLLATALQETARIDEIVSALLVFSRPSEARKVRHDLRETLDESLELVAYQARSHQVRVSRGFPETPLFVRADKSQLKQLFLNLFLNAIQAMPEGGEMKVTAALKDDRRAVVSVEDSGEGIPEANLDRIFDPFFTTKKGGTGLGLSICYNIVKSHQGEIEVESFPGRGTKILVNLPLM
ncbi:MAG: GAF domain-containing sensor histidine kinase [Candidatus Aminicenantales bacterium]